MTDEQLEELLDKMQRQLSELRARVRELEHATGLDK